MSYDVITFGEPLLRLSPPHEQRLVQAHTLEIHVGGTEVNTAVGLARLGLKVAHLSALPRNAVSERLIFELQGWGVDTADTLWRPVGRVGLYWFEKGQPPRASQVIYDRQDSATSQMKPDDLPAIFDPEHSRLLHTTGIMAALSPTARETTLAAIQRAKSAGWLISFDINYRANLWSYAQALTACTPIFDQLDILFIPIRDAIKLFSLDDTSTAESAARYIAKRYPTCDIVMTLGAEGALCLAQTGELLHAAGQSVMTNVGRIGAGDAFNAGFLYGRLQGYNLTTCLQWGNACAALKHTIPGDLPLLSRDQVEQVLQTGQSEISVQR
ncbi:MAG: sugar kinase [Chloroflexi bacterium]|nr:sugar kinase [Chloroflexota bacterium]